MVSILKLNLIVVAVVLAMTAGFVLGLLIPGMEDLEERRAKLAEEVARVQSKQKEVGNVSELYASIVEMDEKTHDFRKRLPAERRFGEFINDVCETLRSCNINDYFPQQKAAKRLDAAKLPASLQRAAGTVILPVSISFETRFTTTFEFLKGVGSLPRLSRVTSLKLVNSENRPGRVSVEMMLDTYHHPD